MFCVNLHPTIILTNTPENDHVRPFLEIQEVAEIQHLFLTSLPGKLVAAAGSGPDEAQRKVICENRLNTMLTRESRVLLPRLGGNTSVCFKGFCSASCRKPKKQRKGKGARGLKRSDKKQINFVFRKCGYY